MTYTIQTTAGSVGEFTSRNRAQAELRHIRESGAENHGARVVRVSPPPKAYAVCITDGAQIDGDGWYVRANITHDCGHTHRTIEAAEACAAKLTKVDKHGNCSAKWYNSKVLPVDAQGRHAPEPEAAYCMMCGCDLAEAYSLCDPCEAKMAVEQARTEWR